MCATSPFVQGSNFIGKIQETQDENYLYLDGKYKPLPVFDDNCELVSDRKIVLAALANIDDDPLVTKENFLHDVWEHHGEMINRIGNYLLPNAQWSAQPQFYVFEDNGYPVFRNPRTGYWHLRTRKGDLVYRTRLN